MSTAMPGNTVVTLKTVLSRANPMQPSLAQAEVTVPAQPRYFTATQTSWLEATDSLQD